MPKEYLETLADTKDFFGICDIDMSKPKKFLCNCSLDKREIFLNNLYSKASNRYKRYLGSPLRYAGGKSLAVGKIIELLPSNLRRVVSPFIGGGSVEIAISKELDIPVVAYDIFDLLVNYWQQQISAPEDLYKLLCNLKPSKEQYEEVKNILKDKKMET